MEAVFSDFGKIALGALLGAIAAFGTSRWHEHLLRKKRRLAVATALLHELRDLEADARRLVSHPQPANRGGGFSNNVFRRVVSGDDLLLFKPATISAILKFDSMIADIEDAISDFRASNCQDVAMHGVVRCKAFFASEQVLDMKNALCDEGGANPPATPLETVDPDNMPTLGPMAFSEWSSRQDR